MRKKLLTLFTAAGMIVCVVPFAGLAVTGSTDPVGNEDKAQLPSVINGDKSFNSLYIQQLGNYFEKTFAFRPQMINADANIQAGVFQTSNLPSVIAGSDGWLYYSSTLNDFLGKNTMSQRAVNNAAHNLLLTQRYCEANGARFIFTVAPNKNSLYPEHMPYYYGAKASRQKNIGSFKSALELEGVNYCDLFGLFENDDETLYLKQDSHWNNKGALAAYNKILDDASVSHSDFSDVSPVREKTHVGDLAKMLYPASAGPEYNYNYGMEKNYRYLTDTKSVEDAEIKTENSQGKGSLYMYRDSFGNALLPFFASEYGKAEFTKAFPVNLGLEIGLQQPDTVIFEIAERNIDWFAGNPPVIPAGECAEIKAEKTDEKAEISAQISEVNMQYVKFTGKVPGELCGDNGEIFLKVTGKSGAAKFYKPFYITADDGDSGFAAYIPSELFDGKAKASALLDTSDKVIEFPGAEVAINQTEME